MATLAEAVQGLPAELYNNILDFVLTPNDDAVTIDKHYKPPTQMRISRATRTYFIKNYYMEKVFRVQGFDSLKAWLASLSDDAATQVRTIHYEEDHTRLNSMKGLLEKMTRQPVPEEYGTAVAIVMIWGQHIKTMLPHFKNVMRCKWEDGEGEGWESVDEILNRHGFRSHI